MSKAEIEDKDVDDLAVELEEDTLEEEIPEGEDDAAPDESDEEELVVTIGEETPPQQEEAKAPQWVRDLRKADREKTRKIRELEAKLATTEQQKKPQLGPKPTLEAFDYDPDAFEAALDKWKEQKAAQDAELAKAQEAERKQQEAFQAKYEGYTSRKIELAPKLKDFDDVEEAVRHSLDATQIGIVLAHAKDPALLVYALGKDENRLADLAKIKDPVEYIFAVARMETQLRTSSRKPSAAPEKTVRGSASTSGGADKRLDQLYTEAAKTGDLSKVRAYKAQLKK